MIKLTISAIFWTLALAIPSLIVALAGLAFLTDYAPQIEMFIRQQTSIGGQGWLAEFSGRLPEVAGMVIGQIVILMILLVTRKTSQAEKA